MIDRKSKMYFVSIILLFTIKLRFPPHKSFSFRKYQTGNEYIYIYKQRWEISVFLKLLIGNMEHIYIMKIGYYILREKSLKIVICFYVYLWLCSLVLRRGFLIQYASLKLLTQQWLVMILFVCLQLCCRDVLQTLRFFFLEAWEGQPLQYRPVGRLLYAASALTAKTILSHSCQVWMSHCNPSNLSYFQCMLI